MKGDTSMPAAAGDPDAYTALAERHRERIRVRGSLFIATAAPAVSREQVRRQVEAVSREKHDATHHCWAFRLSDGEEGSSDAGEPSGTAGRPILSALDTAGVTDAAVVVTRYFGGTKLGTGGLARAYRDAALAVLADAPLVTRHRRATVEVRFTFEQTGLVEPVLSRFEAVKKESEYGDRVRLVVAVRRSRADELARILGEALRDAGAVRRLAGDDTSRRVDATES